MPRREYNLGSKLGSVLKSFLLVQIVWWVPYWLCYNQMTSPLVSQAGVMDTGGVPNGSSSRPILLRSQF